MITILKGEDNTFTTTFTERLINYNLSPSSEMTFYFLIQNGLNQSITTFPLTDTSPAYRRYNQFTLHESDYNFNTGSYAYSGYADSDYTQILESGMFIVSGTNAGNPLFF